MIPLSCQPKLLCTQCCKLPISSLCSSYFQILEWNPVRLRRVPEEYSLPLFLQPPCILKPHNDIILQISPCRSHKIILVGSMQFKQQLPFNMLFFLIHGNFNIITNMHQHYFFLNQKTRQIPLSWLGKKVTFGQEE